MTWSGPDRRRDVAVDPDRLGLSASTFLRSRAGRREDVRPRQDHVVEPEGHPRRGGGAGGGAVVVVMQGAVAVVAAGWLSLVHRSWNRGGGLVQRAEGGGLAVLRRRPLLPPGRGACVGQRRQDPDGTPRTPTGGWGAFPPGRALPRRNCAVGRRAPRPTGRAGPRALRTVEFGLAASEAARSAILEHQARLGCLGARARRRSSCPRVLIVPDAAAGAERVADLEEARRSTSTRFVDRDADRWRRRGGTRS